MREAYSFSSIRKVYKLTVTELLDTTKKFSIIYIAVQIDYIGRNKK